MNLNFIYCKKNSNKTKFQQRRNGLLGLEEYWPYAWNLNVHFSHLGSTVVLPLKILIVILGGILLNYKEIGFVCSMFKEKRKNNLDYHDT